MASRCQSGTEAGLLRSLSKACMVLEARLAEMAALRMSILLRAVPSSLTSRA